MYVQFFFQELPRVAGGTGGHFFGRACHDQVAAAVASFGAEVYHVVGTLDDVQVVLDDDDAVSAADEGVEGFEQLADVVEVEAGGGLVEDEERRVGLLQAQVVGQLDALVLAAREGGRRLPQLDVAQANVL